MTQPIDKSKIRIVGQDPSGDYCDPSCPYFVRITPNCSSLHTCRCFDTPLTVSQNKNGKFQKYEVFYRYLAMRCADCWNYTRAEANQRCSIPLDLNVLRKHVKAVWTKDVTMEERESATSPVSSIKIDMEDGK